MGKENKKFLSIFYILFILLCFFHINAVSYAEINEAESTDHIDSSLMDYIKVTPIFPENQISKDNSYLDLDMTSGQNEIIELKIVNTSDQSVHIYIRPETAITSNEGKVMYRPDIEGVPYDSSLKYPFTELVHLSQEDILLEAHEEKIVHLTIEMPKETFQGVILGGIRFSIDNQFMMNEDDYLLGVRLVENSIEDMVPNLIINNIYPYYVDNKNGFQMILQNTTAIPILNMNIELAVYKSKKLVASIQYKDWNMAPNSSVTVNIPLIDDKPLKTGIYTVNATINSDEDEWVFTSDFSVDKQEAKRVNELSNTPLSFYEQIPTYLWGIIVGVSIFIILVITLILRKKYVAKSVITKSKNKSRQHQKNIVTKKKKQIKK